MNGSIVVVALYIAIVFVCFVYIYILQNKLRRLKFRLQMYKDRERALEHLLSDARAEANRCYVVGEVADHKADCNHFKETVSNHYNGKS